MKGMFYLKVSKYVEYVTLFAYIISIVNTLVLLCVHIEDKDNKLFKGNCLFVLTKLK